MPFLRSFLTFLLSLGISCVVGNNGLSENLEDLASRMDDAVAFAFRHAVRCVCGSPARRGQRTCLKCHSENSKRYREFREPTDLERYKSNARSYAQVHEKRGILERKPCEICGEKAQKHHDDYTKPLEVRWLCPWHHQELHRRWRTEGRHAKVPEALPVAAGPKAGDASKERCEERETPTRKVRVSRQRPPVCASISSICAEPEPVGLLALGL